jgi:uncharacterized protein YodC (DUF2158 family)
MENIKNYDNMDERIFLKPGDIVRVRHKAIEYRPIMYIVEKITRQFKSGEEIENAFVGMKCRWFTSDGVMQEAVFSTKDLELCK